MGVVSGGRGGGEPEHGGELGPGHHDDGAGALGAGANGRGTDGISGMPAFAPIIGLFKNLHRRAQMCFCARFVLRRKFLFPPAAQTPGNN